MKSNYCNNFDNDILNIYILFDIYLYIILKQYLEIATNS